MRKHGSAPFFFVSFFRRPLPASQKAYAAQKPRLCMLGAGPVCIAGMYAVQDQ